jgi:hypothetical protein
MIACISKQLPSSESIKAHPVLVNDVIMPFSESWDKTRRLMARRGTLSTWVKAETIPVRQVEHNLSNLSTVGCRLVAQLDSRWCDRLEFVKDGQIVEHVPRSTGNDRNFMRVEFVTNMVCGHNG